VRACVNLCLRVGMGGEQLDASAGRMGVRTVQHPRVQDVALARDQALQPHSSGASGASGASERYVMAGAPLPSCASEWAP
jgi:hypothetical protein